MICCCSFRRAVIALCSILICFLLCSCGPRNDSVLEIVSEPRGQASPSEDSSAISVEPGSDTNPSLPSSEPTPSPTPLPTPTPTPAPTPTPTPTPVPEDPQILPVSSTRLVTEDDLKKLDSSQLMLARNEIYARHGRMFNDSEIKAYFERQNWYKGTIQPADFSNSLLSDIEIQNVGRISDYENMLPANISDGSYQISPLLTNNVHSGVFGEYIEAELRQNIVLSWDYIDSLQIGDTVDLSRYDNGTISKVVSIEPTSRGKHIKLENGYRIVNFYFYPPETDLPIYQTIGTYTIPVSGDVHIYDDYGAMIGPPSDYSSVEDLINSEAYAVSGVAVNVYVEDGVATELRTYYTPLWR